MERSFTATSTQRPCRQSMRNGLVHVYTPEQARSPQQKELLLHLSDSLLAELEQADRVRHRSANA